MKVKIRKTGEIITIAEYAKIALDKCDSYGNPIEVKPEEIELIQEQTEDEHWQNVRERAAIAAMQGLLSNSSRIRTIYAEECAEAAIRYANTLIEELKKK